MSFPPPHPSSSSLLFPVIPPPPPPLPHPKVINSYMNLLMASCNVGLGKRKKRVHIVNTFFYPKLVSHGYQGVERWIRKVRFVVLRVRIHSIGNLDAVSTNFRSDHFLLLLLFLLILTYLSTLSTPSRRFQRSSQWTRRGEGDLQPPTYHGGLSEDGRLSCTTESPHGRPDCIPGGLESAI